MSKESQTQSIQSDLGPLTSSTNDSLSPPQRGLIRVTNERRRSNSNLSSSLSSSSWSQSFALSQSQRRDYSLSLFLLPREHSFMLTSSSPLRKLSSGPVSCANCLAGSPASECNRNAPLLARSLANLSANSTSGPSTGRNETRSCCHAHDY